MGIFKQWNAIYAIKHVKSNIEKKKSYNQSIIILFLTKFYIYWNKIFNKIIYDIITI